LRYTNSFIIIILLPAMATHASPCDHARLVTWSPVHQSSDILCRLLTAEIRARVGRTLMGRDTPSAGRLIASTRSNTSPSVSPSFQPPV